MARPNQPTHRDSAALLQNVFAALRRHNEYRRRIAQMLETEREHRVDPERQRRLNHVIQARRRHRPHHAR